MRFERTRNRAAFADRRVDVGHEIRRIGRVEIGGFGRVDRRTAADGNEAVERARLRERRCRLERTVGRLDRDIGVDLVLDAGSRSASSAVATNRLLAQMRIDEDRRAPHAEHLCGVAEFAQHASAVFDAGAVDFETVIAGRGGRVVIVGAAAHALVCG